MLSYGCHQIVSNSGVVWDRGKKTKTKKLIESGGWGWQLRGKGEYLVSQQIKKIYCYLEAIKRKRKSSPCAHFSSNASYLAQGAESPWSP